MIWIFIVIIFLKSEDRGTLRMAKLVSCPTLVAIGWRDSKDVHFISNGIPTSTDFVYRRQKVSGTYSKQGWQVPLPIKRYTKQWGGLIFMTSYGFNIIQYRCHSVSENGTSKYFWGSCTCALSTSLFCGDCFANAMEKKSQIMHHLWKTLPSLLSKSIKMHSRAQLDSHGFPLLRARTKLVTHAFKLKQELKKKRDAEIVECATRNSIGLQQLTVVRSAKSLCATL